MLQSLGSGYNGYIEFLLLSCRLLTSKALSLGLESQSIEGGAIVMQVHAVEVEVLPVFAWMCLPCLLCSYAHNWLTLRKLYAKDIQSKHAIIDHALP